MQNTTNGKLLPNAGKLGRLRVINANYTEVATTDEENNGFQSGTVRLLLYRLLSSILCRLDLNPVLVGFQDEVYAGSIRREINLPAQNAKPVGLSAQTTGRTAGLGNLSPAVYGRAD